jgi:hypothetical protein
MKRRVSPGFGIFVGVVATLVVGVLGAFGWLAWIWYQTPESVRARVGNGKRFTVIAIGCVSLAAFFLCFTMTIVSLIHSFDAVSGGRVEPSQKARILGESISAAMNWTVASLIPLPIAVIVAFYAGYRLLRATEEA